jgi:hypothetical protein
MSRRKFCLAVSAVGNQITEQTLVSCVKCWNTCVPADPSSGDTVKEEVEALTLFWELNFRHAFEGVAE